MIISHFDNIEIKGISVVVPEQKDVLFDSYKDVFGADAIKKFSKMTGVTSRYIGVKEQTSSDLAYVAARRLLENENTKFDPKDIGCLIFITQGPDYISPSTAFVLQKRLNLSKDCIAFDVNLGCSGYPYGLNIVASLMQNGNINNALLLVADAAHSNMFHDDELSNSHDHSNNMLFGDAGSATLLSKSEGASPITMTFKSDGNGFKDLIMPGGAYRNMDLPKEFKLYSDNIKHSYHETYMNATNVFSFTLTEIPALIKQFLQQTNTSFDDYDGLVLHQANEYILNQIAKRCNIDIKKVPKSIGTYGNTSSVSVPLTICNSYSQMSDTKLSLLMSAFGIGLSWSVASCKIDSNCILPIYKSDEFYTQGGVSHD